MKTRKKPTYKDWLASILVIFLLFGVIALPIKLFKKDTDVNESPDIPSIDIPVEDEDVEVDVNGVRLNKSEIIF